MCNINIYILLLFVLIFKSNIVKSIEDISYFHFGSEENWENKVKQHFLKDNEDDIIENYKEMLEKRKDFVDTSDTINLDNFDSIFSKKFEENVPKYVPTENYIFIQRPEFYTQKNNLNHNNNEENRYFSTSFIQKIPKIKLNNSITTEKNRYIETDIIVPQNNNNNNSKLRINNMLKKFLSKLYNQKYQNKTLTTKPKTPKVELLDEEKSKFLTSDTLTALKNKTINKINKFFSIFTIIKFNNTMCNVSTSSGSYLGICYTSTECTTLQGTAYGNCASGYGVCCVFKGTCGGWSNQNCTYFESPNYPNYYPDNGNVVPPTTSTTMNPNTPDPRLPYWMQDNVYTDSDMQMENVLKPDTTLDEVHFDISRQNADSMSCSFQVYKVNDNIRQFRIDFLDLELTGPTNGTCADERLVINANNMMSQVPIICGYNSGQHVYVDATTLNGPLQLSVLSNSGMSKRFRIRICQLEDSCSTQSANCLQYYLGTSGVIQSFNYDQAAMLSRSQPGYLNNLNYAICIRREAGYCSITYTNVRNGMQYPFQLVNVDNNGVSTVPSGQAGVDILNCPDDYIVIDGARLCGDRFNDGTTVNDFTMNAPVTDTNMGPIVIQVRTDNNVTGVGFKLFFMQNMC